MSPSSEITIQYYWVAGSMPPPYHSEYEILIQGGKCILTYLPDYPFESTPVWTYEFPLAEDVFHNLLNTIQKLDTFNYPWIKEDDPPVGGSLEWLKLKDAVREVKIPASLNSVGKERIAELYQAIRNAVPDSIWGELREKKDDYIAQFEENP
jgi:hypothetical protein